MLRQLFCPPNFFRRFGCFDLQIHKFDAIEESYIYKNFANVCRDFISWSTLQTFIQKSGDRIWLHIDAGSMVFFKFLVKLPAHFYKIKVWGL